MAALACGHSQLVVGRGATRPPSEAPSEDWAPLLTPEQGSGTGGSFTAGRGSKPRASPTSRPFHLPHLGVTLGFSTLREATADSPRGLLGGHSCCRKASSPKACRRGLFPAGGPRGSAPRTSPLRRGARGGKVSPPWEGFLCSLSSKHLDSR